ncbi:MAG: hypothetical protein ACO2OO_01010 [Candidatus Aenigmatarchaeota archaeon]
MAYSNPTSGIGFNVIRGTATINAGSTSVVVNLPTSISSYSVVVTPTTSLSALWWVSNKTSTSFTINIATSLSTNTTFDYVVIY